MSFNDILMWVVAFGVIIGGLDKIAGNKLGLGAKFEEGYNAAGGLALAVAGIIVLAPALANWLQPIIIPIFKLMHADPAMFASIIANDMGGYPLAMSLAQDPEIGLMAGCQKVFERCRHSEGAHFCAGQSHGGGAAQQSATD